MALLRHYGAATRLIDFTKNAAVGLWFATSNPEVEGELLGISTEYVGGYAEAEPIDESYDDVMAGLKPDNFLFSWEPTAVANRVSAQHSQFLFGRAEELSYGTLRLPLDEDDGVIVISVSPSVKTEERTFLRNVLDIHTQTMFPDVSGFASAFGVSPPESPDRW